MGFVFIVKFHTYEWVLTGFFVIKGGEGKEGRQYILLPKPSVCCALFMLLSVLSPGVVAFLGIVTVFFKIGDLSLCFVSLWDDCAVCPIYGGICHKWVGFVAGFAIKSG